MSGPNLNVKQWLFQVNESELRIIFALPLNIKPAPANFSQAKLTTFTPHFNLSHSSNALPLMIQTSIYPLLFYYK